MHAAATYPSPIGWSCARTKNFHRIFFDFANVEPFPQNIALSSGKNVVTEETFDFEVFGLKYVLIHLESIPIKIFN